MNLEEIREIVDFMKENGLCELEYSEKNTSIKLKLAPPLPNKAAPAPCAPKAPEAAEAPESVEAEEAPAEAAPVTADEVKKAAVKAASAVGESIKVGATGVADFIKAKREELRNSAADSYEVTFDEPEEPAPFIDEAPTEEPAEEPVEAPEEESAPEKVELDTASAKRALKKTGETLLNTAKAGVSLGKVGLRRGKTFLTDLFKPKYDPEEEAEVEESVPEEKKTEE